MSNLYDNFKEYAECGNVPTKGVGYNKVPQNSFYKSVDLINSVIGPVKNVALGSYKKNPSTIGIITFVLASVIL